MVESKRAVESFWAAALAWSSRKQVFMIGGVAVTVTLLEACSLLPLAGAPPALPTVVPNYPHPLTEEADGRWVDDELGVRKHPYLQSLSFSFSPYQEPSGLGDLQMEAAFKLDNEFRILTEELDKVSEGPGIIFNKSTKEKKGRAKKVPVIRFARLEDYLISLGFKSASEPCVKTYTEMPTYRVTRDSTGKLQARFEGHRTFDPNNPGLKARDNEARLYFDKDCLQ